jgi:hypothetical protein
MTKCIAIALLYQPRTTRRQRLAVLGRGIATGLIIYWVTK